MGYYKANKVFTRATRAGMIVGNPEHKDPRGRYLQLDDATARPLLAEKLISRTTADTYHKHVDGEVDGGQVLVDQVAGKRPRVSARWTDAALAKEAALRDVDISKAKDRKEVIKLINKVEISSAPDEVGGTDNAFSRTGRETAETTRHSRRASPQNDVGDNGTVDTELPGAAPAAEEEISDESDEAPSGGGSSEGK